MFLPSPTVPARLPSIPHRTALSMIRDQVLQVRPGLSQESPDFRAAVLLLAVAETGFNVHRLVLRTRLPREFVARCLRRLAENGLWIDGRLQFNWLDARAESPCFWLDVEVALGRKLRRVRSSGSPEWALAGDWIKDFEYAGKGSEGKQVHAVYHDTSDHDPAPIGAQEESQPGHEEAPRPSSKRKAGAGAGAPAVCSGATSGEAVMIGEWRGADWLG